MGRNAARKPSRQHAAANFDLLERGFASVASDTSRFSEKEAAEIRELMTIGQLEVQRNNLNSAVRAYTTVIQKYGDRFPLAHFHRLHAAVRGNDFEFAAAHYLHALGLAKTEPERLYVEHIWLSCLRAAGHLEDALDLARSLLPRWKTRREALETVIGLILTDLERVDEALELQRSLVKRNPAFPQSRWHLALNQLQVGELPEAWTNYEARWEVEPGLTLPFVNRVPRWRGEPLDGKRLLVWREQGVGDELRFARLIRDIPGDGAQISYYASPKLAPLFARSFRNVAIATDDDVRNCDQLFDYQIPTGSLAGLLRPTLVDMIDGRTPWIVRDTDAENGMRARIGGPAGRPLIGLCWRSGWQNLLRNQHYLSPSSVTPLGVIKNATFVCLQYDDCANEVAEMRARGLDVVHLADIDQKNDMVSAAALVGACDLVISAGTAVAELSAALGRPTLLFGKRQSQLCLGTEGIPWHPQTIFLPFEADDPMAVPRSILENWPAIAGWAAQQPAARGALDWTATLP